MPATLPIGPLVDSHPARRPERVTLKGRWITLAPLDASAHAGALYEASHSDATQEAVWAYLFNGPFATPAEFAADVDVKAKAADPHYSSPSSTMPRAARSATRASCASTLRTG